MVSSVADDFRLPRSRILKHSGDIRRVLNEGRRLSGKTITVFLFASETDRFAVLTPKRIGSAVQRNRMKRVGREVYRLHPEWFRGYQVIFFVRRYNDQFLEIQKEIGQLVLKK